MPCGAHVQRLRSGFRMWRSSLFFLFEGEIYKRDLGIRKAENLLSRGSIDHTGPIVLFNLGVRLVSWLFAILAQQAGGYNQHTRTVFLLIYVVIQIFTPPPPVGSQAGKDRKSRKRTWSVLRFTRCFHRIYLIRSRPPCTFCIPKGGGGGPPRTRKPTQSSTPLLSLVIASHSQW